MGAFSSRYRSPDKTTSHQSHAAKCGVFYVKQVNTVLPANRCYDCWTDLPLISEEQLKAFLEKVKTDTSVQEKLKAAADADAVVAIAKDAGLLISADDLKKAQSNLLGQELESVAWAGFCVENTGPIAPTALFGWIAKGYDF